MSGPHLPGRGGLLIALLVSLLVCSAGLAQPFENCPNPKGGDCFEVIPGIPGCQLQSCCEAVCLNFDEGCCFVEWDQQCVDAAKEICTFCGPGNGDCFEPNDTPGCDDVACCEAVCEEDPLCCEEAWDAFCARRAKDLCSCTPGDAPANDDCADAIGINEGDTPFTTLCATPDGPEHPGLPCGQILFPDLGRDVWFRYTATFTGTARAHTCNDADYNTELAVYDHPCACPVDPETILGCDAAGENCPGFGSEVIFDVELGKCYTIRVGGVGTASGTGTLSVGEDMPPQAPPNDDCSNALVLMLDQPTVFDNSAASTDGFPSAVCSFFGQADIKKDVWYDFTPNTDGTFQVSLCDSSFDTKLAVYDGCACPTPVNPIVCNDDFCIAQSRVTFDGVAGQCYKIRAGSSPGFPGGPGQIEVIQTADCPNANTVLTHSLDDEITPSNSFACGDKITTADNAYARSYDLSVLLPGVPIDVTCVVWGIQLNNNADVLADVNLYRDVDGGPPIGPNDDLLLLATQPMLIPAGTIQELMIVTFDPPVTLKADIVLVLELALPDTNDITGVWVGSNRNGQTAPGYIRSDFCGVPTFIDIADIPGCNDCADMHIVNRVIGTTKGKPCPWDLDGNNDVGIGDLLIVLADWGNPYGIGDLLALLANWGPCP